MKKLDILLEPAQLFITCLLLWYPQNMVKFVSEVAPASDFKVKKIYKQMRKHDVTQASFCRFPLYLFLCRIMILLLNLSR